MANKKKILYVNFLAFFISDLKLSFIILGHHFKADSKGVFEVATYYSPIILLSYNNLYLSRFVTVSVVSSSFAVEFLNSII